MKVMHIEAGRHLYGGARQVLYIAQGLAARGVECSVVCPQDSEIAKRLKHTDVPVHGIAMGGDLDFSLIKRLRVLIESDKPDIIHLHSRRGADWLGGLAAREFPHVRVVLSRRVDNKESGLLARFKYRLYDRVIVISSAIREVLLNAGVPDAKLRVVHSAVNAQTWDRHYDRRAFERTFFPEISADADAPVIGMVAQLISRKGHRFMLESLPAIREKHPHARLIFFGQGREESNLKALASRLGLSDVVSFAGFRKDINHWLGSLDVFVHPPLAEGLGVAVLQAAAAGLPIVASRVGGITEIIDHDVHGYLVEPGSVEQISEAVIRMLSDPDRAQVLATAARARVESEFSLDAMVTGNLAVYHELLQDKNH